jgi:oxygen-dependent protoporphyrinogen oxidase
MEREHGGLLRAMLAAGRQRHATAGRGTTVGPAGTLTSFTSGMETFVLGLASALGPRMQCNARLTHCEPTPAGWRLDTETGKTYTARTLVLALPAWGAAALVREFDSEAAATLDTIPSAPIAVVYLGWKSTDVAQVAPGFGFLVPGRERLGILGTLYESAIFPDRAPADHVLWRTMIGGTRDRSAVDEDDAPLVQRTLAALQKLVGVRAAPEFSHVIRHLRGIPQYPVGHLQRLDRLEILLQRHPGLHLSGNSYRGVALNACVREAEALAARLVSTHRGSQ